MDDTGGVTNGVTDPEIYDHYRATGPAIRAGVYRVVGTGDDEITLLRVGDAAGRRVTTGEIHALPRGDLDALEPCPNPDAARSGTARVAGSPRMAYWSIRAFLRELRHRPRVSTALICLAAASLGGDRVIDAPTPVLGIGVIVAGLGLAYVGSGRLRR